jgi:hypothetical protein
VTRWIVAALVVLIAIPAIVQPKSSAVANVGGATAVAADSSLASWDALVDRYFDEYFGFYPTQGTTAGFHQYDARLEDYSSTSVNKQIAAMHAWEKRIVAFDPKGLDETNAADREFLLASTRSALLSLETIRSWEKNPDRYSSGVTYSAFNIMSRKFAPTDDRLRSLIAREKQMPAVFTAARANLKNPPRIYTEIAIDQIPGIISFFQNDVPKAFADATDATTKAEFAKSNAAVIAALQDYEKWLKADLLPRSHGDFRIGAATFSKKLLYDEMVDTPLDRLLEIDRANMKRNQDEFKRIAHELEPAKTTEQVLAELEADHPTPDHAMQAFRDTFDGLIKFIKEKHIITIPSDIRPIVQETPPFARAITTASMDTPGPYEKVAKEAFFNLTLPGPHDTPEEVEGRMEDFNVGTIISTSVHEAYPGHYIQFLWEPQAPTKIRKLLGASTDIEGWAHYCEQMMLDEGYGQPGTGAKDERESKLIRLGQLQDALLRNA